MAELSQPDAAEAGEDVTVDVAVVAGVGAGRQHDPLAGKPLPGEVAAEAERASPVIAALLSAARRAASLSASARSRPAGCQLRRSRPVTVDAGVPAVTLAGHVSLPAGSSSGAAPIAAWEKDR